MNLGDTLDLGGGGGGSFWCSCFEFSALLFWCSDVDPLCYPTLKLLYCDCSSSIWSKCYYYIDLNTHKTFALKIKLCNFQIQNTLLWLKVGRFIIYNFIFQLLRLSVLNQFCGYDIFNIRYPYAICTQPWLVNH